ncbi:MAG: hypothetical protein JST86_11935 [Bacteroidetes bacterium]|nr:hypothetical protein [Bacteroidota bacterium]
MNIKHLLVIIILLVFQFSLSTLYAQNKLEVHLVNKSGSPLVYVSVSWAKSLGLVSDEKGSLVIPDKNQIDSLVLSAIGLKTKIIPKDSLQNKSSVTITMDSAVIDLPEINITKYKIEKDFGVTDGVKQTSYFKNGQCINLQSALLITSYNYPAQCKNVSVFIAKQSSTALPFRLRLYEVTSDGLPGKDLLTENIVMTDYKSGSWSTFNLDSLHIELPQNGFFAAIEWLCNDLKSESGLSIGTTNRLDGALTYYIYGNTGWFQLKIKGEPLKENVMIKVKIASAK